jgi:molybdopterin synthase sulfur carrier subunit
MPVVKFYANLRRITGAKEKVVPGTSLQAILEALTCDFPDLQAYLLDGDRIRAIITLNGHTLDLQTALETPVSELDQIAIFPPISGG